MFQRLSTFSQLVSIRHGSTALGGSPASRMTPNCRFCRSRAVLLSLAVSLVLLACSTVQTTKPGFIGIDRAQRMSSLVTAEQMEAGANAAYADVLTQARREGQLNASLK